MRKVELRKHSKVEKSSHPGHHQAKKLQGKLSTGARETARHVGIASPHTANPEQKRKNGDNDVLPDDHCIDWF